jgi:hypothetical protein
VVDENGRPVASAQIVDATEKLGGDIASLSEKLQTDESGCVKTSGYSRAAYAVHASLAAPGADFWQTRFSDSVVIPPGEDLVNHVLRLKKPLGFPKFTKQ